MAFASRILNRPAKAFAMEMINGSADVDADTASLATRLLPKRERREISLHLRKTLWALYVYCTRWQKQIGIREKVEKKNKRKNTKSKKKIAGCRLKEHVLLRKPRLYSIHQRITSDTDLQVCLCFRIFYLQRLRLH
jgi:hypothetical protein